MGKKKHLIKSYSIRPYYRSYPYKRTVKQFHSLQITASVLFVYFFVKAYVVGTHLNCIDLSMYPQHMLFLRQSDKNSHNHQIRPFLIFSSPVRSTRRAIVVTPVVHVCVCVCVYVCVCVPVPVTLCLSFSNAYISTVTPHRGIKFGT